MWLIDGVTNGSKRPLSAEMCRGFQSADDRGANGPRQLTGSNNETGSQDLLLQLEEKEGEEARDGQNRRKSGMIVRAVFLSCAVWTYVLVMLQMCKCKQKCD